MTPFKVRNSAVTDSKNTEVENAGKIIQKNDFFK
jgi:hypothetical protein